MPIFGGNGTRGLRRARDARFSRGCSVADDRPSPAKGDEPDGAAEDCGGEHGCSDRMTTAVRISGHE
jgi:hypothetical protein